MPLALSLPSGLGRQRAPCKIVGPIGVAVQAEYEIIDVGGPAGLGENACASEANKLGAGHAEIAVATEVIRPDTTSGIADTENAKTISDRVGPAGLRESTSARQPDVHRA